MEGERAGERERGATVMHCCFHFIFKASLSLGKWVKGRRALWCEGAVPFNYSLPENFHLAFKST